MNSTLVANQDLLARLLMKIRGLEKARLCEGVDGLSEPPNFLKGFSTTISDLAVCLDGPLPADGPGHFFEANLPLNESFCSVVPMVSQMEKWTNQPAAWIEFKGLVGG